MNKLGALILLLIVVVLFLFSMSNGATQTNEYMAPLNFGTYKNNYPRGNCKTGSFERSDCSVGNCPLGTTVTDDRYCNIQCAQELDEKDRKKCHDYCMNMVKDCH
jgi:hypothetical protein